MATNPTRLAGLFDRPINPDLGVPVGRPSVLTAQDTPFFPEDPLSGDPCGPGYVYDDTTGFCLPIGQGPITGVPDYPLPLPPIIAGTGNIPITVTGEGGILGNINVAVDITNTGINQVAAAVEDAINKAAQTADNIATAAGDAVKGAITEESESIKAGIDAATTNLGNEVTITTATLAAATAATVGTVGGSINGLINDVKNTITPILSAISHSIDTINTEVQAINDTLLKPIETLYNETIGTIATLTKAIEQDLHDGLSGLLQIPGQLADQLGSFDASLQRTVEQLGTTNLATSKSSITFAGEALPDPFSASFNKALGGNTLSDQIKTTFTNQVQLSSESLQQVSSEAISGIGTLLSEIVHVISSTFSTTTNQLHADWSSVGGMFVGLLDGVLGLLTTVTAMGALASPLIDAAEQEARILAPTRKLDPATVIEAMKRGFITSQDGLKEIAASGLDSTRQKVLTDLSVFIADVNQALDWWYRGIITDADLIENMQVHGYETEDITATKAGSIRLPQLTDLLRWMNFGIITQDEFTSNCKVLRYDDAQIRAILTTYQDRETPQTLSQLSGLLNNSSASFISNTLSIATPATILAAGARSGYHPDLVRYIWLAHWNIPGVQQFIQSYFRGYRTLTEVQERMAIDNIPRELWDELIQINRPLIPFRSIPSYVKNGLMTSQQASQELAAHGFDLSHQQIILAAIQPKASSTTTTAATSVHTLSLLNAKTLWGEGAITDEQYIEVLEAHGYDAETAAAQLKADAITIVIKQQKQTLSDYQAQVESGVMTLDDAITQLTQQQFTSPQISRFQNTVIRSMKSNAKHPSIADLTKFLKAQLITVDQYASELQAQGWQEPWLTAWMGLVSDTSAQDTSAGGGS